MSAKVKKGKVFDNKIQYIFIFQYLYNLDQNSAYYDPKTRSMRDNPFKKNAAEKGKKYVKQQSFKIKLYFTLQIN